MKGLELGFDKNTIHQIDNSRNAQQIFVETNHHPVFNKTRKPNGYWTEENVIVELTKVIEELGHFPSRSDFHKINREDLRGAIGKLGGDIKFREILGYRTNRKPIGYWTEENTIIELKKVIEELGHFPVGSELLHMKEYDIPRAISLYGGFPKFRKLLGYELIRKPNDYWNDETIKNEIESLIKELNHFPTYAELKSLKKHDLLNALSKNGDLPKFRNLLGYKPTCKPNGYWTEENVIKEVEKVIEELGHFPLQRELNYIQKRDLSAAIHKHGGLNYFREKMGYDFFYKPVGYWTEGTIISEIKSAIEELKCFPSCSDLHKINKSNLANAISVHGGFLKFRELIGYPTSLQDKYKSELSSYVGKKGRASEILVKKIIQDWLEIHNLPEVSCNVKLAPQNILEFICNIGKTIGIDVTNTDTKGVVSRKWKQKDYHKSLDELWIVVFSDKFTEKDYFKLNKESPTNVITMSIDGFLENLDYSTDMELQTKIDKYKKCTFRSKREYLNESICDCS